MRWDLFNLQHAIRLYLDTEDKIDWDLIVMTSGTIVEWNYPGKEKPTVVQLQDAWNLGKLEYFKSLQRVNIENEYMHRVIHDGVGCTTTLKDANGDFIKVDARRGNGKDDLMNFSMCYEYMDHMGMETVGIKDYDNNLHEVTKDEVKQIYIDLIGHGLSMTQHKWAKKQEISDAKTIDEVTSISLYQ